MHNTELIVGPCSWESEEQAKDIINFLCVEHDIKYIRGGFRKYRSDPEAFQGVGIFESIDYLEDLKKKYKFKLVVEVFSKDDMEVLKNFADVFQIGSRNAYNTELLKNTNFYNKPVLYKKHFAMSLKEFVAHSKYMKNETIMCLRGDMSIHPQEQRFKPDFIDIPRLRELTKNKICYDVSHSSCHAKYVEKNTLASLVYKPDILMIEVHSKPKEALSDAKQQLDFKQFNKLKELIK